MPEKDSGSHYESYPAQLGGAKGKTKARLANWGWFDDLTHT